MIRSRPARRLARRSRSHRPCPRAVLRALRPGSDGAEKSDDAIVIGISLPLTGDFSEPGKGVQRGYEAWAEARQRERRPARPAGRAGDPRRPVQRRPGRLRLRAADQPGQGRPGLRPVLHPPRGPRRPGRQGLRLPLRRAGRRGGGGVHPGLRQPLLRRPGGRRRPLQPTSPSRSWRCRRTSGPRPRRTPRWTTRSPRARRTA